MDKIKGQDIIRLTPLGTYYHNNCIGVYDHKLNFYLMKIDEIFKFNTGFNGMVFYIIQKRKHKYLEVMGDE